MPRCGKDPPTLTVVSSSRSSAAFNDLADEEVAGGGACWCFVGVSAGACGATGCADPGRADLVLVGRFGCIFVFVSTLTNYSTKRDSLNIKGIQR